MATEYKTTKNQIFDRAAFESLMKRKGFYWQSFEPHGAVKGLFDYGHPLATLEAEVLTVWRDHFVRKERMQELKCSMVTPYAVFKASGHVDKFADFMCKDPKTGEILRADHLIKDVLEARLRSDREARGEKVEEAEVDPKKKKKAAKTVKGAVKLDDETRKEYEFLLATLDDCTGADMGKLIKKHDIRSPYSGNEVEDPVSVNLMFQTQIGATGKEPAFLRPETAQGQFLSFQHLVEYNDNKMPFASASVGYSFRNELSPRSGLLRVREFLMAEIEHFVDPEGGKKHASFHRVRDTKLPLLSRHVQSEGGSTPTLISIGEAVDTKLVDNETLGYFLVRIKLFMDRIGVDPSKLRFRQHMANEMAHYATDCWDCELLNSYGWTECVGCADRSAYDLSVHSKATGVPLHVRQMLREPQTVEEWEIQLDKKKSGPRFKKDAASVQQALDALTQEVREKLSISLEKDGKVEVAVPGSSLGRVELDKDIVSIQKERRQVTVREYIPSVIEPSFGIGRILYSLMEHAYWSREEDAARGVMSFRPTVAPIKVLLVPLQKDSRFTPVVQDLEDKLDERSLSFDTDSSGVSIGKRYARNDELGIPFGITVDYESLEDNTYTLRDRDTTKQARAGLIDRLSSALAISAGFAGCAAKPSQLVFYWPTRPPPYLIGFTFIWRQTSPFLIGRALHKRSSVIGPDTIPRLDHGHHHDNYTLGTMQAYNPTAGQQAPIGSQPKKYDGKNGQPLYDTAHGGHYGASSAIVHSGNAPPPETFTGHWSNVSQGLQGNYRDVLNTYWQNQVSKLETEEHDYKLHQLPLARIKKVMKADPEVKMISAEAPILFAKGCDIFITELTMRAWIHAEENKRRTLQRSDIASALAKSDMFDFLIDIVPREDATPQHKRRPEYTAGGGTYAVPDAVPGPAPQDAAPHAQPAMQPDMYQQQQGMYPPPQQQHPLFDPNLYGQPTGYGMDHAADMQNMQQQGYGNQ